MPCSGASGPTSPDQTNIFIARLAGEANDARHSPALPSLVGASAENCDCSRKGFTSAAQPRAEMYIFWKALRPVSYCGSLGAGLAAGLAALLVAVGLREEQAPSITSATQALIVVLILAVPWSVRSAMLWTPGGREGMRAHGRFSLLARRASLFVPRFSLFAGSHLSYETALVGPCVPRQIATPPIDSTEMALQAKKRSWCDSQNANSEVRTALFSTARSPASCPTSVPKCAPCRRYGHSP